MSSPLCEVAEDIGVIEVEKLTLRAGRNIEREHLVRATAQCFTFGNKKQVTRTATDNGGGAFCQLGPWLFVIDDMSGSVQNRVRAAYWDELENKKASVVKKGDRYIYTLFLEDVNKFVTFAVPEKLFSPNMDALLFTNTD